MPLSLGTKLGPYEILALIGKGGMGEVYKARDTRIDRIVALKVSDAQFSERFEREAKAIGALNHPNISTLHDVGPNYLVMEYIKGTPLKGPLPVDQALKYAAQICDALDAAHKKGITHRDLKPANILVTKAGIKLLDFGLAKLATSGIRQAPKPDEATLTMALTGKNEIVGTLYYMSPEQLQAQANGQEIDSRSDIFSFGLVLFEMLTGKRAFEGSSSASVIAAIMERPAPSIATIAPPALDRLLQRCLAKDPDDRWQSARDLKADLEWIASASGEATTVPAAVARQRLLPWITAGVLAVVAAGLGIVVYRAARPQEKSSVRLDLDLGPNRTSRPQGGPDVILSPDGTQLAYLSQDRLFVRRLDESEGTELPGTQGAMSPFFSPDGQWIAFAAGGKLKKIAVVGGAAVTLCDATNFMGGSWGEDGTIVASLALTGGLYRIPAAGGAIMPLTELDYARKELTHRWPQVIPGAKMVVFTSSTTTAGGFDEAVIEAVSLADRHRKTLLRGGTFGRYLPGSKGSGHLVYVNRGTLFAVPFDLAALEVRGPAVPILEQVSYAAIWGPAKVDVSASGALIYETGSSDSGVVALQWLEQDGRTRPLLAKTGNYGRPSLSPDGRRLALEILDGSNRDIWVEDLERDTATRLTFDGKVFDPIWTPDGRSIVFQDAEGISWARADGGGKPQLLMRTKDTAWPWSFTPNGQRLAYFEATGSYDLWTVPIEGDSAEPRAGKPESLLQTPFDERYPMLSPDGRWLAYVSNESGAYEVYVRAFPRGSGGGKWQISSDTGTYPMWSRTGGQLFFETLDNRVMVAAYTVQGDSFVAEKPRLWSERQLYNLATASRNLDLAPDGKRFAVLLPVEQAGLSPARNRVTFIENFNNELRRKLLNGQATSNP